MRSQPNRNYDSNDVVQTPRPLARALVEHFRPSGRILEPCRGEGAFFDLLPGADWCEILQGRDFLATRVPVAEGCEPTGELPLDDDRPLLAHAHYDWIVTNPPWSKIRPFLRRSMELADHVVFLLTINHMWTKARVRDVAEAGFGIKEIVLVDMPPSFPQSGFQLGAVHMARGWTGDIRLTPLGTADEDGAETLS
jgi:hypothetical protein